MEPIAAKIVSDFGFPFRVAGGLLHDNPFCAKLVADPAHFGPEAVSGAVAVNSGSNACPLTWRATDEEGCGASPGAEGSDVVMDWNPREPARELGLPKSILLYKRGGRKARPMQADRVGAEAGEQVNSQA